MAETSPTKHEPCRPKGALSRREKWVLGLLLLGWILPTVQLGYGIPIAVRTWRHPVADEDWFDQHAYFIYAGFFSRGCIVRTHWEGTHGNTHGILWPIGFLPGLIPAISLACVLFYPRSRKFVIGLCLLLIAGLIVCQSCFLGILAQTVFAKLTLLIGLPLSILISMGIGKYALRCKRHDAVFNWACRLLIMYCLWVLTLIISSRIVPFIGWPVSFAAVLLLITTPEEDVRLAPAKLDIAE